MAGDRREGSGSGQSSTSTEDEGFLGRWSRRKTEARTETGGATVGLQHEEEAGQAETETEHVDPGPATLDPATLPDIDKMGPGSDFSIFMQAGVPPALKTKALRKLWRVKPELANLDGLLDYGEDLTGSFKVVDHLKTAYQVGRGFLKDNEDKEQDGKLAENDETSGNVQEKLELGDETEGNQPDMVESDRKKAEPEHHAKNFPRQATDQAKS